MRLEIAWWDLDDSPQSIRTLNAHLSEGVTGDWAGVPGLKVKYWVADQAHNRWGAVMVWETDRPAGQPLPPNRAADLIGRPPDHRMGFAVEALADPTALPIPQVTQEPR
ncbi:hypothetical protein EV284_3853 [Streptomyces sp. BK022]|uniref:hypothetical protein n=1 Tax=Streptomyces sp. BK022 TaxID=2512123 RepID=UPI00102A8C58|nr:hypothetical protein [Streptomyces sp. BK022]RZU36365.1 hypothetical protein EV284_3853 [Streptomyces sp. BK022]